MYFAATVSFATQRHLTSAEGLAGAVVPSDVNDTVRKGIIHICDVQHSRQLLSAHRT